MLGHALGHLHVPRKLAHLLLFTVRYLDVLDREYRRLRAAMKVRSFRPRMSLHTYRAYGYLVGMLLVRSFDRSERMLAAMKCRGLPRAVLPVGPFCLLAAARRAVLRAAAAAAGGAGCAGVDMNEPLVELCDVDFAYAPDRPVLAGCSFRLEPGRATGADRGPTAAARRRCCT